MDEEKREERRQVIDIDVKVHTTFGKSRNLSMGGLCVLVPSQVPVLKPIEVVLYLPNQELSIQSTALRCSPITKDFYEVGIYFQTVTMSEEDRKVLADFLGIILPSPEDI